MTVKESAKSIGFQKDISYIKEKVDAIEKKLESNYVTKDELLLLKQECFSKMDSYEPTKKLVYGIVALVLTVVFSALISLVVLK